MKISLIAAASENNVIGKNNDLPWKLPDDMKFFVETTKGHHILSGRKNLESFGKLLPNRVNMILTRNKDYQFKGALVFHELQDAIEYAEKKGESEFMIIGGGEIYKQALPYATCIYLTRVHAEIQGDTYFPKLDKNEWELVSEKYHPKDERHEYGFSFRRFERRKKPQTIKA